MKEKRRKTPELQENWRKNRKADRESKKNGKVKIRKTGM